MTTAQSRVQVLDNAPVAPGVCILCGIAEGRKFIDFGKQVDWYGAVYFCSECIGEVARAIGWVPVAEFDKLNEYVKSIEAVSALHASQNKRLTNALSIIFSELDREPESVDDYLSRVLASVEESSGSEGANEISAERESDANESDSVEGSDDLFDDSDFE